MIKNLIAKVIIGINPDYYLKVRFRRAKGFDEEAKLLQNICKKSKTSIDVGASSGSYSYIMLNNSKNVIAFEPLQEKYDKLKELFRNKRNFQVQNCALSDKSGRKNLRVPLDDGRSTLEQTNKLWDLGDKVESRLVEVKTLDDFNFRDIGFIKIDVEGHEESVLSGAQRLLEDSRPNLLVEIEERHKPGSIKSVVKMLREKNYECSFICDGQITSFNKFDYAKHHKHGDSNYVNNFIFTNSIQDIVVFN